MFLPVTSEMVGITSTGISSTISAPSSAAPLEPPDPSVPLPSHPQPARATQQSQPPPSASTLPPYIRAHPPVLPKIFRPGAGSGIAAQTLLTPHVTHHACHHCFTHPVIPVWKSKNLFKGFREQTLISFRLAETRCDYVKTDKNIFSIAENGLHPLREESCSLNFRH